MDVEESMETEFDIHEVRYLGHSRKIGLKYSSNSKQLDQNDAMVINNLNFILRHFTKMLFYIEGKTRRND